MGAGWELISFVARTVSTKHQRNIGLVTVSILFFLLAPLCESSQHCRTISLTFSNRDQCFRLYGTRTNGSLLYSGEEALPCEGYPIFGILYLARHYLFPCPILWRYTCGQTKPTSTFIGHRNAYLHGGYRDAAIVHLVLRRYGYSFPSKNAWARSRWEALWYRKRKVEGASVCTLCLTPIDIR